MKRNISFLLVMACAFAFSILGACGSDDSSSINEDDVGLEEMSSGNNGNSEGNNSSSSSNGKLNPSEKIKPSFVKSNRPLKEMTLAEMDALWNEAKAQE